MLYSAIDGDSYRHWLARDGEGHRKRRRDRQALVLGTAVKGRDESLRFTDFESMASASSSRTCMTKGFSWVIALILVTVGYRYRPSFRVSVGA